MPRAGRPTVTMTVGQLVMHTEKTETSTASDHVNNIERDRQKRRQKEEVRERKILSYALGFIDGGRKSEIFR